MLHLGCSRRSQSGVALIITIILLAVVTFMAITFLAISRRERGAVATTTDTTTAQLAADDALAAAEAQIVAHTLATTNPYNFGLIVSTNYVNTNGFQNGVSSYTNVNYNYPDGNPVYANPDNFLQLLANLYYLPRPPVFIQTNANPNDPLDFRFYLDLNRNRQFDTNGVVDNFVPAGGGGVVSDGTTSLQVGDPEWIGVLQHPDQPYGPNNPFVARYAFIAVPIGNTLDLNAIYNQALDASQAGQSRTFAVNSPTANDAYMRNQGVGPWEINLAAFLADLNTNVWLPYDPSLAAASGFYQYNEPGNFNRGIAFDDARALLAYRYGNNYLSLKPAISLFPDAPTDPYRVADVFPFDNIDEYSDGPLQITPAPINEALNPDRVTYSWLGTPNTNHFFSVEDLFDPTKTAKGVAFGANNFSDRLLAAGAGGTNSASLNTTYNRYTFYRLLSQMGMDSAPEQDQINLNYSNAVAHFAYDQSGNLIPGLVTNITFYPGAETNLMPWTPLQFFTIAADKMLRMYSQEWITESPSNYVATYGMTTNISTATDPVAYPTNRPVSFGISDIPVWVSNRFVYTPAIQRVLQLAANIYDATTNNTALMGADFPSVFRPMFHLTVVFNELAEPVYTNVYIAGYEPVGDYYDANGQIELGTVNSNLFISGYDPEFHAPVNVADLLNPTNQIPPYSYYYGFNGFIPPTPESGTYTNVNVYGVPWIIGAKKGFPNFNEFAMESVFQLTRKLQATRTSISDNYTQNPGDYHFNQMYTLSLSNQLAVECWNSYTNFYQSPDGLPRSVAMYVNDTLSVTLTNVENPFGYTTNFLLHGSLQIPNTKLTAWPGYNPIAFPFSTPDSFQIPLSTNVGVIPTSMYRFNTPGNVEESGHIGPYLTTNLAWGYESNVVVNGSIYPQPHWWLITSNNVQVIMLDTTVVPNHVIDYVQLSGPDSVRDLTSEIISNFDDPATPFQANGSEMWNTNVQKGVPIGILSQVQVSEGNYPPGIASGIWDKTDPTQQANEIAGFMAFLGYSPAPPYGAGEQEAIALAQTSLAQQAPYSPVATMIQITDWQVNDPLVHYLGENIDQPGIEPPFPLIPSSAATPVLTNTTSVPIRRLNTRYMPWGVSVQPPRGVDANPYNLALKDPLVWRSDDWDFPTYKLPTVGWLGRVHRGTPWQTIYLKSPDILHEMQVTKNLNVLTTNIPYMGTNTWVWWTGDSSLTPPTFYGQYYDAANMAPVQDRLLFDLFTTAPDDNATRGQLSVNVGASDANNLQAGLAAWSALLSGVQVLSNNVPGSAIYPVTPADAQHNGSLTNFTTFPINPAGPAGANAAIGQIVTGINSIRANVNNTAWISSIQNLAGGAVTVADEIPATFTNVDGVNGAFEHVGDILAVPQLSVQSPFLNTDPAQQTNGISDEMYDWLPQQVLSLLRVSGTPQSPMRYVIYSYGQALKPAPNGIYTGGANVIGGNGQTESAFGMITNYQIVAEAATRAVVNFGSVVTNAVATNSLGNLISVPVVTNNRVLIKQYNVLPPN